VARIAGVSPDETRAKLVDAAARLFELKGYEGSTVAGIAREAGVTTGAIYTHYERKVDLLVDALHVNRDRVAAAALDAGGDVDVDDPASVLLALARRLVRRDDDRTSLLAEALLASRRDAELAQVLAGTLAEREGVIAELLAEGQRQGRLRPDTSATAAARFALLLALGSLFARALDLPPVDDDEWEALVRTVIDGFVPDQEA